MPLVRISMLSGRTPEQKRAVLSAVTDAVHTTLGTPLTNIRVWIDEFDSEDYMADGIWHPDTKR